MDLVSFIIGFIVGLVVASISIVIYIRMMLKKVMSGFGNVNMLLELLKKKP